jgi:hypothetical protein
MCHWTGTGETALKTFIDIWKRHRAASGRRWDQHQEWLEWARDRWLWPDQQRAVARLARCGTTWTQTWNGREFKHPIHCGDPTCPRCGSYKNSSSPIHARAQRDHDHLIHSGTDYRWAYSVTMDIGHGEIGSDFGPAARRFRKSLKNLLDRHAPQVRLIAGDHLEQTTHSPGLLHHHCHSVMVAPGMALDEVKALLGRVSERVSVSPLWGKDHRLDVMNILRYSQVILVEDLDRHEWLKLIASVESIRGKSGRGLRFAYGIRARRAASTIDQSVSGSVVHRMPTQVTPSVMASGETEVSFSSVPLYKAQPRLSMAAMRARFHALHPDPR